MKEFIFTTKSKSDYLRMFRLMQEKGIQHKSAIGDDWNCHFEITYNWTESIILP